MPNPIFIETLKNAVKAGSRPEVWHEVLEGFEKSFQADTASIIWSPGGGKATVAAVRGLPDHMAVDYVARYQHLDELRPIIHQPLHQGRILLYSRVARNNMPRSEFYNDFILRNGIVDGIGGVLRLPDGLLAIGGQFERTPRHLEELLPIFNLVIARLKLFAHDETRRRKLQAFREGLDPHDDATYLAVDRSGRIITTIEGAYEIADENDLVPGGDASDILTRAVATTPAPAARGDARRAVVVMPSGAMLRCQVWPMRWGDDASSIHPEPRWLIELRPVNSVDLGAHGRVAALLGLTGRETTLSLLIAAGLSLRATAATMGITYESARTYAKRIQQKLALSSHAELALTIRTIILHEGH